MQQLGKKTRFAEVYGAVLKEWMDMEGSVQEDGDEIVDTRPEKAEQQKVLEEYMFGNRGIPGDVGKFRAMLAEIFGDENGGDDVNMMIAEEAALEEIKGFEYDGWKMWKVRMGDLRTRRRGRRKVNEIRTKFTRVRVRVRTSSVCISNNNQTSHEGIVISAERNVFRC